MDTAQHKSLPLPLERSSAGPQHRNGAVPAPLVQRLALCAIAHTCTLDTDGDALALAWLCRDIAQAAEDGDLEGVIELARNVRSQIVREMIEEATC